MYKTITILALLFSLSAESQSLCIKPDFEPLFKKLEATTRISEAIELRRQFLPQLCSLEDFSLLTNLEGNVSHADFYKNYMLKLGDFTLTEVAPYLGGRSMRDIQAVFTQNLIQKMASNEQDLALRRMMLIAVKNCLDLQILVQPWKYPISTELDSGLKRLWNDNVDLFCK